MYPSPISKPSTKQIVDNELISKVISKFANNLRGKKLQCDNDSLLLANAKGYVYEIIAEDSLSIFDKSNKEYLDWSVECIGHNAIGLTAKTGKTALVEGEEHSLDALKKYVTISLPIINDDENLIGILGLLTKPEFKDAAVKHLQNLLIIFELLYKESKNVFNLENDLEKKDALLTISKTLYSTIDVNEVLIEAVKNIRFFYPKDKLELLMTQDIYIPDLPIKQLTAIFNNDDINTKAFMEGKVVTNNNYDLNSYELAVPLKGKQGVYGIINISSSVDESSCSEEKINFIYNVADIISNAFENANLYQQSTNLVKELQLLNDLTKRLNQSLDKDSILKFVISESLKTFDAKNVSIFRAEEKRNLLTVVASNDQDNVGLTVDSDYGYMGVVFKSKEPLIISDINKDIKIEDNFVNQFGCRSIIASPILSDDKIIGIISVSCEKPNHFSFDDFKMLQFFSQHLGLTLTNAFLHEEIQNLAVTDYLTKLYNRSYLDEMIEFSLNKDDMGSILLFDIDDFKKVNDNFGHQIGDKVLIQVAGILLANVRKQDIAARWGGEEIALYLPDIDTELAKKIAERISDQISTETEPRITVSGGIATWKKENTHRSSMVLLQEADQALYEAKHLGKNQVRVYSRSERQI